MKFAGLLAGFILVSTAASALSFEQADELFDRRGESTEIIDQAAAMYESLLNQGLTTDDAIYATEQIAKLQTLRAQMIPKSAISERKPFLQRCLEASENISPKRIQEEVAEYYYWRASCLAQHAEASGITASLRRAKDIREILLRGRELDRTYQGGGFDRILGAMYSKLPSINPFGPAGDLDLSLSTLAASVNSPAHETELDPAYGTGNYYFETYYLIAEAWIKKGDREKARRVIDQAIIRIDRGDFPPHRKPETVLARKRMLEIRP